jgi:acyl carrier protein
VPDRPLALDRLHTSRRERFRPLMPEPLVDRVLGVVARIAGPLRTPAAPGPDTPLAEGGFWLDSAGVFEVVLACEAEFDVRFDAETDLFPDRLLTVATLADTIRGHMPPGPEPGGS